MENKSKTSFIHRQHECCICFEEQIGKITSTLPCKHEICVTCTITLSPPVCPLCRKDFSYSLETFKNTIMRCNIPKKGSTISYTELEFPSLPTNNRRY